MKTKKRSLNASIKPRPAGDVFPSPAQYQAAVDQAFTAILDLMEKEWGHRPNVTLDVVPALLVRAKFNIKGFQHKGRTQIVHAGNIDKARKPHLVARAVAAEITSHRNTCAECGDGIASLFYRERGHGYSDYGLPPEGYMQSSEYNPETKTHTQKLLALNVMPDAVEQLLHPHYSKRVATRISALPPEKQQNAQTCKRELKKTAR